MWDNRGGTVIGNDVWTGYEAVIPSGVPSRQFRREILPRRKRLRRNNSNHRKSQNRNKGELFET